MVLSEERVDLTALIVNKNCCQGRIANLNRTVTKPTNRTKGNNERLVDEWMMNWQRTKESLDIIY